MEWKVQNNLFRATMCTFHIRSYLFCFFASLVKLSCLSTTQNTLEMHLGHFDVHKTCLVQLTLKNTTMTATGLVETPHNCTYRQEYEGFQKTFGVEILKVTTKKDNLYIIVPFSKASSQQ